jgi:triosephosphate isomerase
MNGDLMSLSLMDDIIAEARASGTDELDIGLCPPATLLSAARQRMQGSVLLLGGQDCSEDSQGACTGELSARMIAEFAKLVILGHSERRVRHFENNGIVQRKCQRALEAGLVPIVCVGETLEERQHGDTLRVIVQQIRQSLPSIGNSEDIIVAYEPVWAIGSGKTPTTGEIEGVHRRLRLELGTLMGSAGARVRLLYGGSVKAGNAAEIAAIPNVDGALVGSASLSPQEFGEIVGSYREISRRGHA